MITHEFITDTLKKAEWLAGSAKDWHKYPNGLEVLLDLSEAFVTIQRAYNWVLESQIAAEWEVANLNEFDEFDEPGDEPDGIPI